MARSQLVIRIAAYAGLLLPFVAILWVPLYARDEPRLAGLPFFYWYQFAWVLITVALMTASYHLLRRAESRRTRPHRSH